MDLRAIVITSLIFTGTAHAEVDPDARAERWSQYSEAEKTTYVSRVVKVMCEDGRCGHASMRLCLDRITNSPDRPAIYKTIGSVMIACVVILRE